MFFSGLSPSLSKLCLELPCSFHPNILRTLSILSWCILSFLCLTSKIYVFHVPSPISFSPVTCQQFFPRDFGALRSQALVFHPECIVPYGFPPTTPRSPLTSPALATILDKADVAFLGDIVVCQPATLKTAKIARLKILDRSCIDHARLPKQVSQSA